MDLILALLLWYVTGFISARYWLWFPCHRIPLWPKPGPQDMAFSLLSAFAGPINYWLGKWSLILVVGKDILTLPVQKKPHDRI